MQVPNLGHPPTDWRPYVKKSLGVDTTQFSSRVSHTRARAHTHTHAHSHIQASTHTLARITARKRACVRRAASSALWCAPYPLPLSGVRGVTQGDTGGETVRCLGLAKVGWVPPSVPRRSLARPSGPWIKAILTEQSGLDATFPPPRLGKGGAARRKCLQP